MASSVEGMSGLDYVPDARDGLTLIQRRVLLWLGPADERRQVCRTVIDRARRQSELTRAEVYGSLCDMETTFHSRYPLVDGEGNFGTVDGESPASSLETEARHSTLGDAMFGPGDRRFNREARHAIVHHETPLQGTFPTLLANGTSGGIASVPPHHLGELASAITARVDDPSVDLDRIRHLMPGPDYPGGGEIVDLDEVVSAYATGRGTFRLRTGRRGEMPVEEEVDVLFVALVDDKPEQCTLLDLIDHYIDHQRAVRTARGATDVDDEIKRDLAALAAEYAGERRTRLPMRA